MRLLCPFSNIVCLTRSLNPSSSSPPSPEGPAPFFSSNASSKFNQKVSNECNISYTTRSKIAQITLRFSCLLHQGFIIRSNQLWSLSFSLPSKSILKGLHVQQMNSRLLNKETPKPIKNRNFNTFDNLNSTKLKTLPSCYQLKET